MAKNKDTKQKDWSIIYSEIADLLAEFYEDNRDSSPQLLYKILSEDSMFIKKQKWFINLKTYKSSGVDPVHVFASFNNGKQRKESKLEIIQDWFSILTGSGIDNDIIFEGCPSPFTVRILSGRNTDDQIEIWEEFYNIYKDKSSVFNSNLDMKVKKWYGLSFTSITIFLFWIDSKRFISLDKNTTNFLLKYRKDYISPNNFSEYSQLLAVIPKSLYRVIVNVAYDRKFMEDLSAKLRAELNMFMNLKEFNLEEVSQINTIVDFKFIGIRILDKTDKKIKKNLKDELYLFYTGYSIIDDLIIINKNKNFDLYSIENLKINLSAIVGKNGSGKSAISELIYMAINNLYIHCLNKDESDYIDYVKVNGLNVELYFESYGIYKITFSGQNVTGFEYHKIDENDNEYKYKIDSVPFEINKEFLEKLFYTVSVNYSLHGLNSKNHEDWLESLFIKNDGYENPIVFEPNREEGIINIHKQEELLRLRFISNIIELVENEIISEDEKTNAKEENDTDKKWIFESTRIGESSEISIISLKISNKKTDVIYKKKDKSIIEFKDDLLSYKNIIDALKENFDFRNVDISTIDFDNKENNQSIALRYIVKKIIKIAETYSPYREIFWDNQLEEIRNIPTFINKLSKDPTHVTNKVYQAVNYLAGIIKYQNKDYDIKSIVKLITTSKVEYNNSDTGNLKTIHLIPPPFFENKILVRDINKLGNNTFLFELLSSGERQQIYSVHSIIYHLKNIDSIDFEGRIKYRCVNLILDEVELYAHPEMQRKYVNDLLSLIKLNEWQNLSGLNICFITHSPFILSDIPSDRIMFLTENGEQDKEILTKTFGANIHELLTDGFFLSNTIGEYALNQIRDIIDFHTSVMNADKVSKINLLKVYNDNKKRYNYLVDNIGEDYISGILKNHINDIETSLYGDQYKEVKIKELELEIERIKEMK